jgi:hypothetical protein
MEPLSTPSREDAALWMRDVGILNGLEAAEVLSTARPARRLRSLLEVAEFLVPFEDPDGTDSEVGVNFVDPNALSLWTRETVGDSELADRMDEIIGSRKAYAFLVPQLKALVLGRVVQYWELLRPDTP